MNNSSCEQRIESNFNKSFTMISFHLQNKDFKLNFIYEILLSWFHSSYPTWKCKQVISSVLFEWKREFFIMMKWKLSSLSFIFLSYVSRKNLLRHFYGNKITLQEWIHPWPIFTNIQHQKLQTSRFCFSLGDFLV